MRWFAPLLAVALVVAGVARPALRTIDSAMVAWEPRFAATTGERHHVLRATTSPDKRLSTRSLGGHGPVLERRGLATSAHVDGELSRLAVATPAVRATWSASRVLAPPARVDVFSQLIAVPPSSRGPPRVPVVTHPS